MIIAIYNSVKLLDRKQNLADYRLKKCTSCLKEIRNYQIYNNTFG
ncbi:hypothetical protein [Clostridium sp. 'White wine YQ']|nr:hypothetical protein [Clostridium sp. 'White wine YQ']MDD7792650.1 hypothetical protein [Clostridium sp. 'White wine YQ']